jgi:hypothetical protein
MHDGIGRHVGVVFAGVAGWEVVGGGVAGRDVVGVIGREAGPDVDRWVGFQHDGLFGFGRPGPILGPPVGSWAEVFAGRAVVDSSRSSSVERPSGM